MPIVYCRPTACVLSRFNKRKSVSQSVSEIWISQLLSILVASLRAKLQNSFVRLSKSKHLNPDDQRVLRTMLNSEPMRRGPVMSANWNNDWLRRGGVGCECDAVLKFHLRSNRPSSCRKTSASLSIYGLCGCERLIKLFRPIYQITGLQSAAVFVASKCCSVLLLST